MAPISEIFTLLAFMSMDMACDMSNNRRNPKFAISTSSGKINMAEMQDGVQNVA